MAYEECDRLVARLVPELLSGTGLSLVSMYPSRRALSLVEDRDAFEFRIGVNQSWTRIIKRLEIGAMDCSDAATMMDVVAGLVVDARKALVLELRALADKMESP